MTRIRREAIDALMERARREVDEGLLPGCQVALGFEGELIHAESLGDARDAMIPVWLGICLGKLDQWEEAASYFRQAADQDPYSFLPKWLHAR